MVTTRFPTLFLLLVIIAPIALAVVGSIFIRQLGEFLIGSCFCVLSLIFLATIIFPRSEKWLLPLLIFLFGFSGFLLLQKGLWFFSIFLFFGCTVFLLTYLPPFSRLRALFRKD